ncbi:MAG: type III-B CRISPR module-associated protein Cmr5 [Magnetococcus sp. WYHC-3]
MSHVNSNHDMGLKRARYCFKLINDDNSTWLSKESISTLKALPVQLRTQGLVVTIAVLLSKGNTSHIVELIAKWLLESAPHRMLVNTSSRVTGEALLAACANDKTSRLAYMTSQKEAILLAQQAKIYAVAMKRE